MSVVPTKKNRLEGRKLWFFFTAVAGLLTGIVFFFIASQVTATTKYYVLIDDVPARSQISEASVQEVITSTGGQPPTSVSESDIISGELYTKYALDAGDVLSPSNVGLLSPINTGLPADFVTATFTAPASMAAGGKVARGDYIDIITIATDPETGLASAGYTLQHALVVDATIDLDSAAGEGTTDEDGNVTATAADSGSLRTGIPTMYTLGLTSRDATKLALAVSNTTIYVVISANQDSEAVIPDVDVTITAEELRGLVSNSGLGTDSTFGINEDELTIDGVPVETNDEGTVTVPENSEDTE